MPFALIVGTNHHRQTIVFGAALLFNESSDSFVWLFKAFMKAMCSKQPATIFTDQCAAMPKAIMTVFPSSSHHEAAAASTSRRLEFDEGFPSKSTN
jgi:zinc finger SWIM domain-containing protein 3